MSWVEKELKKRASNAPVTNSLKETRSGSESAMAPLWSSLENANNALPDELKLQVNVVSPKAPRLDGPEFKVWIVAPNGAALGYTGDAIRYVWPAKSQRKSHNFWIRWEAESGFAIHQRTTSTRDGGLTSIFRFNESRVAHMIRCLVTGKRIKARSVRRRRFWLF